MVDHPGLHRAGLGGTSHHGVPQAWGRPAVLCGRAQAESPLRHSDLELRGLCPDGQGPAGYRECQRVPRHRRHDPQLRLRVRGIQDYFTAVVRGSFMAHGFPVHDRLRLPVPRPHHNVVRIATRSALGVSVQPRFGIQHSVIFASRKSQRETLALISLTTQVHRAAGGGLDLGVCLSVQHGRLSPAIPAFANNAVTVLLATRHDSALPAVLVQLFCKR